MSINFIIFIGISAFVIGIVIGIACARKDNDLIVNKIDSSFQYKFVSFEGFWKHQIESMHNTLNSLARTVYELDASNIEKNKNIQLNRVIKIITEELKKT